MKSSKETGREFAAYIDKYCGSVGHGSTARHIKGLFDAHTTAVSYEAQKHILLGLREHAFQHSEDNLDPAVVSAWQHEVNYIGRCLETLEEQFGSDDLLDALKHYFGEDARNFAGIAPATEAVDPAPQANKFADIFRATHIHLRSQGLYRKLYDASVEATMEHVVVHCNAKGETFTRPATEFYDIERFQELSA